MPEYLDFQFEAGRLLPQVALAATVLAAFALALLALLRPQAQAAVTEGSAEGAAPRPLGKVAKLKAAKRDEAPRFEGTFVPSSGLVWSNPEEPWFFENEYCTGLFVPLHRPTHDEALMKSNDYPYGEHFKGRRRQWELRWQLKMKIPPTGAAKWGIELDEYVPLNAATKKIMSLTVAALRQVVGKDVHHSPGDDPKRDSAPHEKPVFVMPLWAFDQVIETPEGEDPPSLTDPHFYNYGTKRADDLQHFVKMMAEFKMEVGPTYTLAFWGISHFLDAIKWEVQRIRPGWPINFDMFCGAPPVSLVLYQLDEDEKYRGETRHLQSRKQYYFLMKFWSSRHQPSPAKLQAMLPAEEEEDEVPSNVAGGGQVGAVSRRGGFLGLLFQLWKPGDGAQCLPRWPKSQRSRQSHIGSAIRTAAVVP